MTATRPLFRCCDSTGSNWNSAGIPWSRLLCRGNALWQTRNVRYQRLGKPSPCPNRVHAKWDGKTGDVALGLFRARVRCEETALCAFCLLMPVLHESLKESFSRMACNISNVIRTGQTSAELHHKSQRQLWKFPCSPAMFWCGHCCCFVSDRNVMLELKWANKLLGIKLTVYERAQNMH